LDVQASAKIEELRLRTSDPVKTPKRPTSIGLKPPEQLCRGIIDLIICRFLMVKRVEIKREKELR